MNKRLLKTNYHFQWIRILLYVVPLIVPGCAKIVYDEEKFNIFDPESTRFESEILKSLQTTTNFFAISQLRTGVLLGVGAGVFIPPLAAPTAIIFVTQALLADESDWRGALSTAIASETKREIASFTVEWMDSALQTIGKKYHLMSDNSSDQTDRKTVAFFTHFNIDRMLNFFDRSNSLLKKHPLIATPLLIQLAQLVACFDPLAKSIFSEKGDMEYDELSCTMRKILLDYRPRAVSDRLDKVHTDDNEVPWQLHSVVKGAYSPHGYSKTTPPSFNCERCSDKSYACLNDDLGDRYELAKGDDIDAHSCVTDYGLFARHRVEELYDHDLINQLNAFCSKTLNPTGSGWLTIKFKHLRARVLLYEKTLCDIFSKCDPFVRLFIDGEPVLETDPRPNVNSYDVGVIYTSPKITKKALIKIEVWHANTVLSHALLLRREGNVDSFLENGYMKTVIGKRELGLYDENHLNTISFWQDEYK